MSIPKEKCETQYLCHLDPRTAQVSQTSLLRDLQALSIPGYEFILLLVLPSCSTSGFRRGISRGSGRVQEGKGALRAFVLCLQNSPTGRMVSGPILGQDGRLV